MGAWATSDLQLLNLTLVIQTRGPEYKRPSRKGSGKEHAGDLHVLEPSGFLAAASVLLDTVSSCASAGVCSRDPGRHAPQPGPQCPLLRTRGRSQALSPPLTCRLDLGKFAHSSKPQSPVSKMNVTPEPEVLQGRSEGYMTHGTLFFQQMGKKESAPRESAA